MGGGGGVKKQQAEKEDQMKTINRCSQNLGWALVRRGEV